MTPVQKPAGFTLVEVIVALSLLGLIMLGLLSGLRSMADSSRRMDLVIERTEQIRMVGDFLRRSISQAQALPHYTVDHGYAVFFKGDPQELLWVAPFPSFHGLGGLHVMRLSKNADTRQLILDYAPYAGFIPGAEGEPLSFQQHLVLDEVDTFEVFYRKDAQQAWVNIWEETNIIPGQVRIHLRRAEREWPDIIIALRSSEKPI